LHHRHLQLWLDDMILPFAETGNSPTATPQVTAP